MSVINLTKKLRFGADVLGVLEGMTWEDEGRLGKITAQLPRPLYVAVNKALEGMGGTWNRKVGGHVFPRDPRDQVEGLVDSGVLVVERDGFFETPSPVIERMLEVMPFLVGCRILEPSAGEGAIARMLVKHGARTWDIQCVEKNADRVAVLHRQGFFAVQGDFMEFAGKDFDRIYMNPPFEAGQDVEHVMHAWDLLTSITGGLVSVMGEHAFFADDKRSQAFREFYTEHEFYSETLPDGSFKASGTGVNARLVWGYR